MENFIPTRPEFLTKDWVLMVINQYRDIKHLSLLRVPEEIQSITCSPHPLARGNLSTSYCVTVNYTCNTSMGRENIEYKLYFKMTVLEGQGQEVAVEAQLMEKEVETLLRLFPRVRKMIVEKNMEKEVSLPLPEIVYGSYSSSGEGVLVAMDMMLQGYSRPEYGDGLSLTTMVAAVEALGKIHGTSAVFMNQEGQDEFAREFPHLERSFYESEAVFKQTSRLLKEFSDFVKRVPGFFTQHQQLEQWRSSAWNLLSSSFQRRSGLPPPLLCVTHGNLSAENLLMKDSSVLITSWATATVGSPLMDLAMLLLSSCSKQFRSEHTKQLLDTYHFTFCSTLGRLGVDQKEVFPTFSITQLVEEYDRCLFVAFHQAICLMMEQIKELEVKFMSGEQKEEVGEQLRQVGRRAMELVDDACLRTFKQSGSCQVESSSLTITIPGSKEVRG
eukprot:GFUD01038135.1.p1 GENE.GFUD01038135.1~~GFUD01038135.1.p1  ORF type:complete len:443 (+),score=177.57 GFUD01038135.1:147-1475(+)